MPFIGVRRGSGAAEFYVPDKLRLRWLAEGNRIARRVKPEDIDPSITKVCTIHQARAVVARRAAEAAAALAPPPPVPDEAPPAPPAEARSSASSGKARARRREAPTP